MINNWLPLLAVPRNYNIICQHFYKDGQKTSKLYFEPNQRTDRPDDAEDKTKPRRFLNASFSKLAFLVSARISALKRFDFN